MEETIWSLARRQASALPHDPWLFEPRARGWHWISFAAAAIRIEGWRSELRPLPRGLRAGFAGRPGVDCLLLDLALQEAGLVSAPLPPAPEGTVADEELARRGCNAWVEGAGAVESDQRQSDALAIRLRQGAEEEAKVRHSRRREGRAGALVRVGEERWKELSGRSLVRAARRLAESLGAAEARDVVIWGGDLEIPQDRRCLAWALSSAAAVVTIPRSASLAGAALWARPTVLFGDGATLGKVGAEIEGALGSNRRRQRRHLGRLRALVVTSGSAGGPGWELWERLGAAVLEIDPSGGPERLS